jgi:phage virion morphogenesis protein
MQIEVKSDPVRLWLNRLSRRMSDMSPAMEEIRASLVGRVSERFEFERDPLGKPWTGWSEATKKSYPKDGNMRLLDRYSDMLGSLYSKADAHSTEVGFGQPYSTYHEFGTKKMPRRGLLFADPETGTLAPSDEEMVVDIIKKHLHAATKG